MVSATALLTDAQYNGSRQSSWTTASLSPTAGRFIIAVVTSGTGSSTQPPSPTITGCNLTWTAVNTYLNPIGLSRRITVYRAVATNPSSGTLTIDFSGVGVQGVTVEVVELTGIDTTGTNGSNGIVQSLAEVVPGSATSKSMTLSALAKADNITFGACMGWGYATAISPGSGYTELTDTVNTVGSQTQMQVKLPLGSTTVNWSFADANDGETGAIALELKTVPDGGGFILTIF